MITEKLAIVDLDGVIADSSERFAQATWPDGSIDWDLALNGDKVYLNTPIAGVHEALNQLHINDWTIVYLTSRLWHMEAETREWLDAHHLHIEKELVMKPEARQFTRTPQWKADMTAQLITGYKASDILVVDDEHAGSIIEAVSRLPWISMPHIRSLRGVTSLQEALIALGNPERSWPGQIAHAQNWPVLEERFWLYRVPPRDEMEQDIIETFE